MNGCRIRSRHWLALGSSQFNTMVEDSLEWTTMAGHIHAGSMLSIVAVDWPSCIPDCEVSECAIFCGDKETAEAYKSIKGKRSDDVDGGIGDC